MKNLIFVVLLGLTASCDLENIESDSVDLQSNVEAEFNFSGLAYDGCDTHISVSTGKENPPVSYIASPETINILNSFAKTEEAKLTADNYVRSFPIIISFKKTGKTGELICGWNARSKLETIDITKIARK